MWTLASPTNFVWDRKVPKRYILLVQMLPEWKLEDRLGIKAIPLNLTS
jgi:hypothetical protein